MQPHGENALNVPAFLSKLWKMVNDPTTDHLISWGQVMLTLFQCFTFVTYVVISVCINFIVKLFAIMLEEL